MSKFKPMRASKVSPAGIDILPWKTHTFYMSEKLDGVRGVLDLKTLTVMSKSMKPIPNRHVQAKGAELMVRLLDWADKTGRDIEALDVEMTLADPRAGVYAVTSVVMSHDDPTPVVFNVFDVVSPQVFRVRLHHLQDLSARFSSDDLKVVGYAFETSPARVLAAHERLTSQGSEGLVLRDPDAFYYMGNTTVKSGAMVAVVDKLRSEGTIIGANPLMRNHNEAFENEMGLQARSSHQENKVADDLLGALEVQWQLPGNAVTFNIGTGFTELVRKKLWEQHKAGKLVGQLVTFEYKTITPYGKPRGPVFVAIRHPDDMVEE